MNSHIVLLCVWYLPSPRKRTLGFSFFESSSLIDSFDEACLKENKSLDRLPNYI